MTTATSITAYGFTGFLGRGAAPRELECLLAIAGGATGKEAARALGMTEDGVKKRLLALTTKLGVNRRAALVAEAFRRGLITPMIMAICAILVAQVATSDNPMIRVRRPGERRVETRVAVRRIEVALTA